MPLNNAPILYSFRRCPYAMRARMALYNAGITVELREVVLRDKPPQLLAISTKATVPVLLLNDNKVIAESLDIMYWALSQQDPNNWLKQDSTDDIDQLIKYNDGEFKHYLDRYKYADRYPEHPEKHYREHAEQFILKLENKLSQHPFLFGDNCCLADIAIFPFIRQFANVDLDWFQKSPYKNLNIWLNKHIKSELFLSVMDKYPAWHAGDSETVEKTIFL